MNEQNIFKNDNVTSNSAQLEILKKNFPNCFDKDGHFILDSFKEVIKENDLDFSEESYSLNWLGKSYAQLLRNEKAHTFIQPNHDHNNQEINKNSQNLLIKGDNLEVLKHLRNAYSEKIKMIYIDPPYNTGSDGFIYQDDRKFSKEELMHLAKVSEDEAKRILDFTAKGSNSHSAWLTFIYPRLYIARELLQEDGVIFISIDENEQSQLKLLCDEIFGEENHIENLVWNKRIPKNDKGIGNIHEYLLLYAKNSNISQEYIMRKDAIDDVYNFIETLKKSKTPIKDAEKKLKRFYNKNQYDRGITLYNALDDDYRAWGKINMSWPNANTFGPKYDVLHPISQNPVKIPDRGWRWKLDTFKQAANLTDNEYLDTKIRYDGSVICNKIWFSNKDNIQPSSINYLDESEYFLLRSIISTKSDGGVEVEKLLGKKGLFPYPKPTSLINTLISSLPDNKNEIYLDFFAGSGTTAHAVMDLNIEDNGNRQFILVQLPEVLDSKNKDDKAAYDFCIKNKVKPTIFSITKARIEKAGEKIKQVNPEYEGDLGFKIFETVPLPDNYNNEVLELNAESQLEMFDGAKNDEQLLNAILTTWTLYDRIPLTDPINEFLIDDYKAQYSYEYNTLYLMQPNFTTQNIKTLINKIETDPQFIPEKIVIYGFNFDSKIQRELDEALKSYQNKKSLNIDLLVRYY